MIKSADKDLLDDCLHTTSGSIIGTQVRVVKILAKFTHRNHIEPKVFFARSRQRFY